MKFSHKQYGFLRIAAVTPKLRVADVGFNCDEIISLYSAASEQGCRLVLFPELALSGYTCADLFFQQQLLETVQSGIEKIRESTIKNSSIIIVGAPLPSSGKLYNCAVVVKCGEILGIVPKTYLCNTNEYYEERWFSSDLDRDDEFIYLNGEEVPFGANLVFRAESYHKFAFGIEICEDMWSVQPTGQKLAKSGTTVICNLSASNEYLGKTEYREALIKSHSASCIAGLVYSSCGPWESTTDTVFSGHSMIAENGKIIASAPRFSFNSETVISEIDLDMINNERQRNNSYGFGAVEEEIRIVEFEFDDFESEELYRHIPCNPFIPESKEKLNSICSEIVSLQSASLAKRLLHTGIIKAIIGISGGLDSTLALISVIKAFEIANIDKKGIIAVSMPGFATSSRTRSNSGQLIEMLGVIFMEIDIIKSVSQHLEDIGHDGNTQDITYENAQARERTQILMDLANKEGGLVIGTGDLSELALGWCTYAGDQISMYNMNAGVPKTLVMEMIKWYAEEHSGLELKTILYDIIDTPISPELVDSSKDFQDTESIIGPYELHDFFLYFFLRYGFTPAKILLLAEHAFSEKYETKSIAKWLKVFLNRFFANQFKRSAIPDGVKIGSVSLSPRADWRMPSDAIVNLWLEDIEKYMG